jgi:hypothetical protein
MANMASSLTQHVEDTFELADTILAGIVYRMEIGGTGTAAMASLPQTGAKTALWPRQTAPSMRRKSVGAIGS